MRNIQIAAVTAIAGLLAAAPAAAVQTMASKTIACADIDGVVQVARSLGYDAQTKSSDGQTGVFFLTKGKNVVGITTASSAEIGGCFALVFLAPFGVDGGGRDGLYAKYNMSELNGFGAVAGKFEGHSVLAHTFMAKAGMMSANLEMEVELFAERADVLARALAGGGVSAMNAPANPASAFTSSDKTAAANPAIGAAMSSLFKSAAFVSAPKQN